jgi:shikimate kinase
VAPRTVILVGLSGAGKSTAGARAAERLNARAAGHPERRWDFEDLDREIERRTGRTVAEIFARQGEAAFRKLEVAASAERLGRERLILATGGGWIQLTETVRALRQGAVMLYLQVSPAVAAERLAGSAERRPLLEGADPAAKLQELLDRRQSLYLQADHTLSVDSLSVDEVASYIVALATGGTED